MAARRTPVDLSYTDALATLPFTASSDLATGFLPPLFRAMGHILGLRIQFDGETPPPMTDRTEEMTEAVAHLERVIPNLDERFSETTKTSFGNLVNLAKATNREITTWNDDETKERLIQVVNRFSAMTAILDRELLGLRNSEPGFSL